MAVNRFDSPANLAVRDTFVPQTVQIPFQELSFGLQQRQNSFDQNESLLNEGLLALDVPAISQDIEQRNKETEKFEDQFQGVVDSVSGDLSLAKSESREFAKNINRSLKRGKLSAIQNRFKQQQSFFSEIDKRVNDGKLSAQKGQAFKQMSNSLTPNLENEDGSFNDIAQFPISEEVSPFERGLELTKNLAKDGFLQGIKFDDQRGIMVDISGERITQEKAFKSAFQALASDRLTNDSLNQDSNLILFATQGNINEESLDLQIAQLISLNNRDRKGNVIDLEVEQDIRNAIGQGTLQDKLRIFSELKAANDIANQVSGSKFNRSIKGIPGFGSANNAEIFGQGVTVPIKTKFNPSIFNNPDKVNQAKNGVKQSIDKAKKQKVSFLKDNNITENNPITPDGIDLSNRLAEVNANIKQLELDQDDILQGEKRVLESVGLSVEDKNRIENTIKEQINSPEFTKKLEKDFEREQNRAGTSGFGIGPLRLKEDFIKQAKENIFSNLLKENPAYKKYIEALEKNSEAQTLTIGVTQISDSKTRKSTENSIKTILGNVGLGEASQSIRRLGSEDIGDEIIQNDVISEMKKVFVDGVTFTPESGDIQVVFQAANQDGDLLGRFSTKAPKGIVSALVQENQFEFLDISLHNFANSVRNSFDKKGKIMGIEFDVQSQTEIINNNNATRPYVVTINKRMPDGRLVRVPEEFSSEGQALNLIKNLLITKLKNGS